MGLNNILSLCAVIMLGLAVFSGNAIAEQKGDMDGVKAASQAFYEALRARDNGEAMEKVWAHTSYVTMVGPRSKSVMVGWDAQKEYWAKAKQRLVEINVTLSDQHIHVNGDLAWEMGLESGTVKLKDGTERKAEYLVTNVYEKIDGRWLMVSHHVQPMPQ